MSNIKGKLHPWRLVQAGQVQGSIPSAAGGLGAFPEPRHVGHGDIQAQPDEAQRVSPRPSVDRGVGTDLRDQVGGDQDRVKGLTAAPGGGEPYAGQRAPGELTTAEREELRRLRRLTAEQAQTIEVLRKAAVFFAKESDR
ncbi:hypothetical protein ACWGI0_06245 [Streptomyces sp. NPDC054802]